MKSRRSETGLSGEKRGVGWRAQRTPLRQSVIQRTSRTARPKRPARIKANSGARLAFHRILVPIDFSVESTRALKVAANLEPGDGADLLLVHVVGPIYDLRDFGYGLMQRCRPNERLMRQAKQRLQTLGRRHMAQKRKWQCVVRSGTAPHQILKVAEELRVDLVVIPTHGLARVSSAEVGSTAERIVRHAACPVLVLPKQTTRKRRRGQ